MPLLGLLLILAGAAVVAGCATQMMCGALNARPLRILAWGTVFVAAIVLSITLPATIAELTTLPLVRPPIAGLTSSVLAFVIWAIVRRWGEGAPESGEDRTPLCLDLPRKGGENKALPGRAPGRAWLIAGGGVVAGLHVVALLCGLVSLPTSWDGTYYHIPTVLRWWQQGRLSIVPGVVDMSEGFNGDLWLLLAAYVGWEPLFELAFVPFGPLLAVAVYALARELGAGRTGALAAGGLVLATPMVVLQMYSAYVDLFGATFAVAAIVFALRCLPTAPRSTGVGGIAGHIPAYALLFALSAGLAIGTKLVFLIWLTPGVAWVAIRLIWNLRVATSVARHARPMPALVALLLGLLPGTAFWYFRATYHTGWPLYPFVVRIAGHTFGSGLDPSGMLAPYIPYAGITSLLYPWFEWKARGYPYTVSAGLGPAAATFGMIGMLFLATRARLGRPRTPSRLLVIAFLLFGAVLYITVLQSVPRHALVMWMVLVAASAPLLDLLLRRAARLAVPLLAMTLVLGPALTAVPVIRRGLDTLRLPVRSRAAGYGVPELLDHLPPGTIVLNLGDGRLNLALFGAHWTNNVIWPSAAEAWGLTPPLTASKLAAHGVEYVYQPGGGPAPFAADVRYRVVFGGVPAAGRFAASGHTYVYRVERGEIVRRP